MNGIARGFPPTMSTCRRKIDATRVQSAQSAAGSAVFARHVRGHWERRLHSALLALAAYAYE